MVIIFDDAKIVKFLIFYFENCSITIKLLNVYCEILLCKSKLLNYKIICFEFYMPLVYFYTELTL